jgi:hypothetical protein
MAAKSMSPLGFADIVGRMIVGVFYENGNVQIL